MPGKFVVLLTSFLFCFLFHSGNNGSPGDDVLALYRKADQLFKLDNPTDETDSIALVTFRRVIQLLENNPADTLLFQSWLKTGVLLDIQLRYNEARDAYLRAIHARRQSDLTRDSTLFQAFVYTGTAYYHLNNFDSADYYLQQAETIGNNFPRVPERDRLYNALGALYYENGNYVQSRNYFSRALEIIRKDRPRDKESAIHFEGNIAASYYRLGLYEQSLKQYQALLSHGLYTSQISVNMGKAYALTGNYPTAMRCFRRVDPNELPGVYNDMANVQLLAGRLDSAAWYLNRFSTSAGFNRDRLSKLDIGINYVFRSDLLNKQQQHEQALEHLQKAITIFSGNFNNTDINSNPADFAGSFASYKLFDALYRKAKTFKLLYGQQHKKEQLQSGFDTYQHTISLLRYIEKSYDTDDARIFLQKNSQQVYHDAFSLCLQLIHLFKHNGNYAEAAFVITEKSKASVMAAKLTESRLKKMRGIDPLLLQQERNIKYNIARLNIQSEQSQDKSRSDAIEREKEHYEIELSKLQKKIEQNSSYYKLKYSDSFPGVKDIQDHIAGNQAVISLYAIGKDLYTFIIGKDNFGFVVNDDLAALKTTTEAWITQLNSTEAGRRFNAGTLGQELYDKLVEPFESQARTKEEWIIIPDDIFHYLPFESIPAGEGPLLEKKVISYHFSSRFLASQEPAGSYHANEILSMAPFSARAFLPMNRLPASAGEIAGLGGMQLIDSSATKDRFLQALNHYPVVHLATHAMADINKSSASYIAFYPSRQQPSEDNLYLDELYGLNMDSTDLVIISACETGAGKLIGSEGVMSLSRGFTYAGCNAVVNSLWKADDAATAAILKQFHVYLQKGYGKAKALQLAKLDYMRSDALHISPNYWSHLILIGDTGPVTAKKSASALWISLGALGVLIFSLGIYLQGKRKKSRRGFSRTMNSKML